jgi:hypothetical protein
MIWRALCPGLEGWYETGERRKVSSPQTDYLEGHRYSRRRIEMAQSCEPETPRPFIDSYHGQVCMMPSKRFYYSSFIALRRVEQAMDVFKSRR